MEDIEECWGIRKLRTPWERKDLMVTIIIKITFLLPSFFLICIICVDIGIVPILQMVNRGLKSINHLTVGSQVVSNVGLQLLTLISNSKTFH